MPSDARVACSKLCITPLGVPVEPEVYMMKQISLPSRAGLPAMGAVLLMMSSQLR